MKAMQKRMLPVSLVWCLLLLLHGCNGNGSDPVRPGPGTAYTISGQVTFGGAGLSGVTIALTDTETGTTTTGTDGSYSFTGLANGTYTLTPSLAGYTFVPATGDITITGRDVTFPSFVAAVRTIIAAGGYYSLVRKNDGTVWAWGDNGKGQLGNGTNTDRNVPGTVSLPPGTKITVIAAAGHHSLALTSTGQVLAWGRNIGGELGNGTTIDSNLQVPVSLPPGTAITAFGYGLFHSLALTSTGQVLAWGENTYGQLGNGANTDRNIPVPVSLPPGTTITAVAGGGGMHSLAFTSTGQVLAWGYNFHGELGNGTNTDSNVPVAVSLPPGTTITAIAGGALFSSALTSTGQVLAWGWNQYGELGNGTNTDSSVPVQVSLPPDTTITAIATGESHTLARTSTGQLLAWGSNTYGALGNGANADKNIPVAVTPF